jgi:AbrB family looped-hinge helix DNA binding protein
MKCMNDMTGTQRPARPLVLYGAVTVGTRGQIVIPQRLRRELGIAPGEQLLVLKGARPGSVMVQRLDTLVRDPEDPRDAPASSRSPGRGARADTPRAALVQELSTLPHFAGLPPAVLDQLAELVHVGRYEPGEVIEREGEPCAAVYIVRSGLIRRFKTSTDGKEQVTKLSGPGEGFGEVPLFDGGPNYVTVQAVEATELYLFPQEAMRALIAAEPAVALGLATAVAALLRHFSTVVEDLSFRHVTGRVAHALLELTGETTDVVRISQQELAAMAGTGREVAGRVLRTLEDAGALHLERGKITLLDRVRLGAYV